MGVVVVHLVALFACVAPENQLSPPLPPGSTPPAEEGEDDGDIEHVRPPVEALSPLRWPHTTEPPPELEDGDRLYVDGLVHEMRIELSAADIASLQVLPTNEVEAKLSWRNTEMSVALRLKGSASFRPIDQKPSFKIDVHEWEPEQRIDGEKRITLNNMIQDETMMREHAYYWMARRIGVPAPRHAYARVWVNGTHYGLYSLVETMDEEFVERAFDDDEEGNLYESSGADFTYDRDWFDLQETGGVVPTPDDIDDLVDAAEEGGNIWTLLNERFDVDTTLSYWALDIASGNDDGYVYNHHNFLVYYGPNAGKWSFVPWGTDRSFTQDDAHPRGNTTNPLLGNLVIRCWEDATCADALTTRIEEVLDIWDAELLDQVERTEATIESDCHGDPRREFSCDPDDLTHFIEARSGYVRSSL